MAEQDIIGTIYAAIESEHPYYALVEEFYAGVEKDPLLRPLYPPDLTDAKRHLALFLIQRTGGAPTYNVERGHPRMRMRHAPFRIGLAERDAWLLHMNKALNAVPEFVPHRDNLYAFFIEFATFLVNQPDQPN